MRAIQISSYVSGPLDLSTISLPTPSSDQNKYLIKIHACGTNFFDLLQIRGKYQHQPPLPWISGMEFAGTILATPTSTKHTGRSLASSMDGSISNLTSHKFKIGDRVFGAQKFCDFSFSWTHPCQNLSENQYQFQCRGKY